MAFARAVPVQLTNRDFSWGLASNNHFVHDTLYSKLYSRQTMPSAVDKTSDAQSRNARTQLYKGVLEMALLALLQPEPQYGLKILDRLRAEAGLNIAEGTLYPLLYRLEKQNWIKPEWRFEEGASHPRKYYTLTKRGQAELAEQLREWNAMTRKLNAFLKRGDQ
jgi:PadR family transcriptional regulator PadR